jgi:hypothetical protein
VLNELIFLLFKDKFPIEGSHYEIKTALRNMVVRAQQMSEATYEPKNYNTQQVCNAGLPETTSSVCEAIERAVSEVLHQFDHNGGRHKS